MDCSTFDHSSLIFTYVLDLKVFDQHDFFEKAKLYLNIPLYFLGQKIESSPMSLFFTIKNALYIYCVVCYIHTTKTVQGKNLTLEVSFRMIWWVKLWLADRLDHEGNRHCSMYLMKLLMIT